MNIAIINLAGIACIALIVWWFWLSKPLARQVRGEAVIEILVDDGVYTPARIEVLAAQPVTLRFIRKDPSPCAEKVVFDDFGVTADLPVGKPEDVTVIPAKPGEYEFTCQMRMYRGTLVAR